MNRTIIFILVLGIFFKLALTSNGNFLFNMDNARDLVDVREIVVLGKIRLIGPTSAIEGLFNGPAWYYLLAVPLILSGGNPYSTIILQIVLWAIGGYFLLKITSGWSKMLIVPVGFLWIASDYINLATLYAFNPNPVTLLSPFLVYLLYKYLKTEKLVFIAGVFFFGGLFFNFEMNFGIFIPLIIFVSTYVLNKKLLMTKNFWIGSLFFIICLMPQVIFELRHNFFMTGSVANFLRNSQVDGFSPLVRFKVIADSFFNVFSATMMNHKTLSTIILLLFIPVMSKLIKQRQIDKIALICLIYIFIPFIFYLILPVTVNAWHLGGPASVSIILVGFLLKKLWDANFIGKLTSLFFYILIFWFAVFSIGKFLFHDRFIANPDPSLYKNEISVIDYVYKYAAGENFKVYVFMPSVIDYPYQYLFWWYGKNKYGYIPYDYAYAPNKPKYIGSKEKFEGSKNGYKGLVFLIKEPNRGFNYKSGWEADYRFMDLLHQTKLGNIDIEVRKESFEQIFF